MKKTLLFLIITFWGFSAFGQKVKVVSSNPVNGAEAVNQDSIQLVFNIPVHLDTENPEYSGFQFFVEPEDSVTYDSLHISEDGLTVTFYLKLSDNTDYISGLTGVIGENGEELESPYIFQFTTADQAGPFTVEGTLEEEVMAKILSSSHSYNGVVVILTETAANLGFTDEFEEGEDTADVRPVYAATVDTLTGEYSISGIREGSYYPAAYNLFQLSEESDMEFFFPDIYIYDPNDDLEPDSINVNATAAPNDTLSGINLKHLDFSPITFSQAVDKATGIFSELDNDPVIVGGGTFYSYYFGAFEDDTTDEPTMSFDLNRSLFKIEANSASQNKMMLKTEDDGFDFLTVPNGYHLIWEIYAYDAVKDSALGIMATPFGAEFLGYFGKEEADLPTGAEFSDIKVLPETYIDSDSAVAIAETEGGAAFRGEFGGENGYWDMQLQALHEFWEYPPDPSPNAPVFWRASYYGSKYDFDTGNYTDAYLEIYIDIATGSVLYTESKTDSSEHRLIKFSEALQVVNDRLHEFDNNPEILGGYTWYEHYYEPEFSISTLGRKENLASYMLKPSKSVNEIYRSEHENMDGAPDGYQMEWEVFAYDEVKDSVLVFYVWSDGLEFDGYVGIDDAELPPGVSFSDFKTIPETYIDSDSAVAIAEAEGGAAFREQYSMPTETEDRYWVMDLQALHEFWNYPPDPSPNAPVFWRASYYGWVYDYETSNYSEGYFDILIDIQTGEILYTEEGTDSLNLTPITFSEAVQKAEEALGELDNDPVIVGGSTWYQLIVDFSKRAVIQELSYPKSQKPMEGFRPQKAMYKDEHEGWGPDGYQTDWQVYGYDAVRDSAFSFFVTSSGAEFMGYIGSEEAELPEGVEFSSIKVLPETYIDSDSAMTLIEAEGGAAFREEHTVSNDTEFGYWYLELEALHAYWTFTPDPTPDAPVFWKASYYGEKYNYETEEYSQDSLIIYLDIQTGEVLFKTPTSLENNHELPESVQLFQNYPNPFNPSTNILFELNRSTRIQLDIYNLIGQKVATLASDVFPAGSHVVRWNATGMASGMYFYRLTTGNTIHTKKLMLVK